MVEMKPQKRPYVKLEQNKTYHLEFIFDQPFATEKEFNGRLLKGYKYAFKDLETGEEFSCIISQDAKTAAPLLEKMHGDQIDLTLATYEQNGQRRKAYRISEVYKTPVAYGHSAIVRNPEIKPVTFSPRPEPQQPQNTQSQAIDLDEIDF